MLSQAELKSILKYDPKTGVFVRLKNQGPAKKGDVAGTQSHPRGYIQISVKSVSYYAHRLAWLYMKGYLPPMVDHKDGDTSNNKWGNLRECSMPENMQNLRRSGSAVNKSGHVGVNLHQGKWKARIRYVDQKGNKQRVDLGRYNTKNEAIAAYNSAKATLHHFHPSLTRE